jgi:hypothetical protein
MILHNDLAGLEFLKNVQNRTGFLRSAFGDNILSLIMLLCRRMCLAVSPISFRLTVAIKMIVESKNRLSQFYHNPPKNNKRLSTYIVKSLLLFGAWGEN